MRFALLSTLLLIGSSTSFAVELTVVTERGFVRFTVPDEWKVLKTQTKPPVSALVFQIENPADAGTPHSTNVAVSLMDTSTEAGKAAASRIGKQFGAIAPKVDSENDWTVYTQRATQNGAQYAVVDATRNVADVVVSIRFAWPELPENAPNYNASLHAAMQNIRASVSGGMGLPPERPGEVVRRPQ
jgi:hypothetical protein